MSGPYSAAERTVLSLLIAAAVALTMMAQASNVRAADDIQVINLGPHVFYVPKAWMQGMAVTASLRPKGTVRQPQSTAIDAAELVFSPGEDWQPYGRRELPDFIRIIHAPWERPPPLDAHIKKLIADSATLAPDSYGFVRVLPEVVKSDATPAFETFLYKGFLNKFGEPMVVSSNNTELSSGYRGPSVVNVTISVDMGIQYDFDNKKFPESTWWDLYQRTLTFVDYLQTQK
jgi:hypothetical protein